MLYNYVHVGFFFFFFFFGGGGGGGGNMLPSLHYSACGEKNYWKECPPPTPPSHYLTALLAKQLSLPYYRQLYPQGLMSSIYSFKMLLHWYLDLTDTIIRL